MDAKWLIGGAVVLAAVAGGLYWYGSKVDLTAPSPQEDFEPMAPGSYGPSATTSIAARRWQKPRTIEATIYQ